MLQDRIGHQTSHLSVGYIRDDQPHKPHTGAACVTLARGARTTRSPRPGGSDRVSTCPRVGPPVPPPHTPPCTLLTRSPCRGLFDAFSTRRRLLLLSLLLSLKRRRRRRRALRRSRPRSP